MRASKPIFGTFSGIYRRSFEEYGEEPGARIQEPGGAGSDIASSSETALFPQSKLMTDFTNLLERSCTISVALTPDPPDSWILAPGSSPEPLNS
jgi:hypothetical protein